jgi:hypothetical protein
MSKTVHVRWINEPPLRDGSDFEVIIDGKTRRGLLTGSAQAVLSKRVSADSTDDLLPHIDRIVSAMLARSPDLNPVEITSDDLNA